MKTTRLIKEFEKYKITPEYELGRIVLYGGDDKARQYYTKFLAENLDIQIKLIFDLAKIREDVYCQVEERAAIRAADNLPGDFWSAIKCAFIWKFTQKWTPRMNKNNANIKKICTDIEHLQVFKSIFVPVNCLQPLQTLTDILFFANVRELF